MTTRDMVKIDEEKCDGCGLCVPSCAEGALQIIDGKARLIDDSFCDGLGACLGDCPQGAITVEKREAVPFDEDAVLHHMATRAGLESQPEPPPLECGCPGSALREIKRESKPELSVTETSAQSSLATWPVQLMLVPPTAPFLKDADLLVSADCVPFAFPDFHSRFLEGRTLLVGCPKLDDLAFYRRRLEAIFTEARPRSVTVLRMKVPCCGGIVNAVADALQAAAPATPLDVAVIGVHGEIIHRERLGGAVAAQKAAG